MLNFDILKIQKEIEDFRLNFALKFQKFLQRKLEKIQQFFLMVFLAKNFANFAIILIAAISVFAQINSNFGNNSAFNLQLLLQNNKNFLHSNSSFNFYLFFPAIFLTKIFNISLIFCAIIFINFCAILSLFFVKNIIENSDIFPSKLAKNILILAFTLAFFTRPNIAFFNDFFTPESLLLIFLLPYLTMWIAAPSFRRFAMTRLKRHSKLSSFLSLSLVQSLPALTAKAWQSSKMPTASLQEAQSKAWQSTNMPTASLRALHSKAWQSSNFFLAIFIILINPFFVVLILAIEIFELIKKQILWQKFLIKITAIFAISFIYFYFDKSYLSNISLLFPSSLELAALRFKILLREGLLPIIYFIFASYFFLKNDKILQKFYLIFFAVFLAVFLDIFSDFSARFLIVNLALPLVFYSCYLLLKNSYFDFKKQGIFLLIILIISQFDAKNIFALAFDISSFFFVFVIYFTYKEKKNLDSVFYPKSLKNILTFAVISLLIIITAFDKKLAYFSWFFSSIIFANFIYFAQRNFAKEKLNILSASAILLVLSYFISLNFSFSQNNFLTNEIIKISKKNLAENENLIIISNDNLALNSLIYLQKDNLIKTKNLAPLFFEEMDCRAAKAARNDEYLGFENKQCNQNKLSKIFLTNLINQFKNKQNKLIFIKNSANFCEISFLEQLLRKPEFAESFLKNYQFSNRIIKEEEFEKINFFKNQYQMESKIKFKKIIHDFEIYIAK